MNHANEKDLEIATDEAWSSPSGAKTLLLLGASFVAGYLLGRRRVERTWDAGRTVEITDPLDEPADVAGPADGSGGGREDETESDETGETSEEPGETDETEGE